MKTRSFHRWAWLLAGLIAGVRAGAQATTAVQYNTWGALNVQAQLGERWWFVHDEQWRRSDGIRRPMQAGFLFSPEYRTGPYAIQAGYAYWTNYPYGAFPTLAPQAEHRTWEQVGYKHALGRWAMDHRLRLEQRYLERFSATPEGPESRGFHYVGRLRYRTRLLVPLNAKKDVKGEWQGIVSQEVMVRFGDPAFHGAFDQARPSVQVGFRPSDDVQVLGGCQLQYLVRPDGVRKEFDHTLLLALLLRFPLP